MSLGYGIFPFEGKNNLNFTNNDLVHGVSLFYYENQQKMLCESQ